MPLAIGSRLGPYEIVAPLGAGGMGEVYRAHDPRLERNVAIKVLPERFTADPDRLARFTREARVLASLSHPNVAVIHEVGGEGSTQFLVMELVAGETLAVRLARAPVGTREALSIALQIACALEAAHERGIVHRDLKPANVMVDDEGRVKVLDFGLARALEPDDVADAAADSPTLSYRATVAGVLLGTAAYMSPEQAQGKPADRRSDVWSLGVVLLEMLTGRPVFTGTTASHVVAGVLRDEPPWEALPEGLSPRLRRLLERCLRKDPRRRLQAVGDVRVVLEEVLEHPELDRAPPPAAAAGPRRWPSWAAMAAAVAGAAIAALLVTTSWPGGGSAVAAGVPLRFHLALPGDLELALDHQYDMLAISRDGMRHALLVREADGIRRLAVRDLRAGELRILTGTDDASSPTFSPDGEWLAYFAGDRLWRVAVAGGAPAPVAAGARDARGATWSDDGYIYAAPDTQAGLQRVRETGGAFEPVTELDGARSERTHRWPHALPGGRAVLFTSDTTASTEFYDDARIEVLLPTTGERQVVVEQASRARSLPGGHLLFARGGSLYALAFDVERLVTSGNPAIVQQGVATTVASGAAHFAVSDTGSLLFLPATGDQASIVPVWVGRDGRRAAADIPSAAFSQLALSPEGDRVALLAHSGGEADLWVADLQRGTLARLTYEGSAVDPTWSPDGEWIVYSAGASAIRRQRSDGSGRPEEVLSGPGAVYPSAFSPDGSLLVVEYGTGEANLGAVSIAAPGRLEPLVEGRGNESMASISPDGRWLAYVSTESGRPEVYVQPMTGGGGKWQISSRSGIEPRWSADGSRLFYRSAAGELFEVAVEQGQAFLAGRPTLLFGGLRRGDNARTYSVSAEAPRFLALDAGSEGGTGHVELVLGWQRQVDAIIPAVRR